MPKRNPRVFTIKEMNQRLKVAKDYIATNDRVRLIHSNDCIALDYDSESIDAFLTKERLDHSLLQDAVFGVIVDYVFASDIPNYKFATDPFTFCRAKDQSRDVGLVVPMVFHRPNSDLITKHAACWLGTWHHAPVIAWNNRKEAEIKVEKLPFYSDLL
jgi:hypothetical protein